MDDDIVRILVSTDNHLGFLEKDPIRGNDSFAVFEEILRTATARKVDFLLLAGDLFHENKPSRNTLYNTLKLLQKYCLNSNDIYVHILNENNEIFNTVNGKVNYENPFFSIGLPIFSIHGNHDDPLKEIYSSGQLNNSNISSNSSNSLAAMDLLSINNLINYIGKSDRVDDIVITPILLQKNNTKIALYSLGAIRDERLNRMWGQKKVKFVKLTQEQNCDEFFNIFILHQNRYNRNAVPVASGLRSGSGSKNYIMESMIPSWMDLVIWGNEHECQPYLMESLHGNFRILQPGSSIACSLNHSESNDFPKHMAYFEIKERKYRVKFLPYNNVRLFVYDEVNLHNNLSITLNQTKYDINMRNENNCSTKYNTNDVLDLNTELQRTKTYKFDINDPKLEETIKIFCINKVNNLINTSQDLLLKDNEEYLLTEKLFEINFINSLIYEEENNFSVSDGKNSTTYDSLFMEEDNEYEHENDDEVNQNLTRENYLDQLKQIKMFLTYNLKNKVDINSSFSTISSSAPYFSLINSHSFSSESASASIATYFYASINKKLDRMIKKKLKYNFVLNNSNKVLLKLRVIIDEFFPVINTKRFGLLFYLFLCNPSDILTFSKKKSTFFLSNKDEISNKISKLKVDEINEKNLLKYLIINGNEEEMNSINMNDIINEELYLGNNNLYILKIKEMNEALDNYVIKNNLASFSSIIMKNLNEVKQDLYKNKDIKSLNSIHEKIGYKINENSNTNPSNITNNILVLEDEESNGQNKPKKRGTTKTKEKSITTKGKKGKKQEEVSEEEIDVEEDIEVVTDKRRSSRAKSKVSYKEEIDNNDDENYDIELYGDDSSDSLENIDNSDEEIELISKKLSKGKSSVPKKGVVKHTKRAKNLPINVESFSSLQSQIKLPKKKGANSKQPIISEEFNTSTLATPLTLPLTLNSNQLNELQLSSFPFTNENITLKEGLGTQKKKVQLPLSFTQGTNKLTPRKNTEKMMEEWD